MKPILSTIIEQQELGTILKGRGVVDNTMVVLELFHSILSWDTRLPQGNDYIAIKLDMEKV